MSSDDLRDAVERGDLETVRRLVEEEGVDVNTPVNNYNNTALHFASLFGNVEVVQCLLENKAHVNARDPWGNAALHMACRRRRRYNIRVIQLLIDHKADINARNNGGRTALHCAIRHGAKMEVVQCLIDHNADVNITDQFGMTPLHQMGERGSQAPAVIGAVMELLLSHDVDLHVKDNEQRTPLHVLVARDSCIEAVLVARDSCIEAVRGILDHLSSSNDPTSIEAALTCRDNGGCLPFHCVKHPEMAKLLLERPLLGEDEDRVVPQVCHEMLFAKDGRGQALLDTQKGKGPLFDYLASFTGLPLTIVPERTLAISSMSCCEHRDKRPRRHEAVPLHPDLNEFQRSTANAFLNKWDQSFQQPGTTLGADREDVHAMLPDDLKYVIMAYLTPADIMKI